MKMQPRPGRSATRRLPPLASTHRREMESPRPSPTPSDRKSTRLNSSHTEIYTLSYTTLFRSDEDAAASGPIGDAKAAAACLDAPPGDGEPEAQPHAVRSEEHTSELQSHRDLHSFLHDALPI